MTRKARILCVDDEPINLTILEELLQDFYELETSVSGEECLQRVGREKPDLILLDVNMPGVDGLATCRHLREDPESSEIPIIFISALASHSELLAGYEAGGDDYITKPFSDDILQKKIEIVLASQRRKMELKLISKEAVEALQINLDNSEALSIVMEFLNQSHAQREIEELVDLLLTCLRKLDFEASLLVVDGTEMRIWFSDDIDRPMERQILESLRGQDHVVSFGTRVAINSDHATLLVRKLPVDQERTRRLRELLEVLLEGFEVRIRGIEAENSTRRQQELLSEVLNGTRDKLGKIDQLRQAQGDRSHALLSKMSTDLQKSLKKLDPNQRQMRELIAIIESTVGQADTVYDSSIEIVDYLQQIIDSLSQALES